ncbi:hypothetical protein F4818DRAFT_270227 [Hypoxylon cercidicola]|nr:hypothetical protein F4818DRAFT_270227 [Hypoxylon cercidicola]
MSRPSLPMFERPGAMALDFVLNDDLRREHEYDSDEQVAFEHVEHVENDKNGEDNQNNEGEKDGQDDDDSDDEKDDEQHKEQRANVVLRKALRQLTPGADSATPPQNAVIHQDDYLIKQQQQQPVSKNPSVASDWDCIGDCDFSLLAQHIGELDAGAHPATIAPDTGFQHLLDGSAATAAASPFSQLSPGTLDAAVAAMRHALTDALSADEATLADHVRLSPHGTGAAPRVARRFVLVEGATVLARNNIAAAQDPVGWAARRVQDRLDACLFLALPLPLPRPEA